MGYGSVKKRILIIHNVRSAHNVGSLFRTADGAGVEHIYCVGITPRPIDEFGRVNKEIAKTALGAEGSVPWTHEKSCATLVHRVHKDGVTVIALEQSKKSEPLLSLKIPERWALVVGNEVDGIPSRDSAKCDIVADLPMRGVKESLNVSVAAGIALYYLSAC